MEDTNKKNRILRGVVSSTKMDKTCVVEVTRLKKHSKYRKYFKVTKSYKAHDESEEYKKGDKVLIQENRPMSKTKRWTVAGRQ
jgi:small subunit ribosomal protein S17